MVDKITPLSRTFGLIVYRRRIALKYTQEVLAKKSGLHRQTITLYEMGRNVPNLTSIFVLAKGLKTTPSALMQDVQDEFYHGSVAQMVRAVDS